MYRKIIIVKIMLKQYINKLEEKTLKRDDFAN